MKWVGFVQVERSDYPRRNPGVGRLYVGHDSVGGWYLTKTAQHAVRFATKAEALERLRLIRKGLRRRGHVNSAEKVSA